MVNSQTGKQRYKLLISYDGTGVSGWQRQAHTVDTIQETLEKLLFQLYGTKIAVVGSSRTDSGVHAEGQVAHFDAVPDAARSARLFKALNRMGPRHIVVKGVWEAPPEFHAIRSTLKKTYKYRIFNSKHPSALFRHSTDWVYWDMNLDYLNELAQMIVGTHDFKAFQTDGSSRKTTVRTILEAKWVRKGPHFVEFTITGTGFLKQMVRNLVGTMIYIDKKKLPASHLTDILASLDRRKAGPTAVARGLSLYRVYYPQRLDIGCRKI